MARQEGARQDGEFIVVSLCPDVCKSPVVPVPYPIIGRLTDSIRLSPNVRARGVPIFHMDSRVTTVNGDEAGTGGGVISQVNKGFCKPVVPVPTVRINSYFANDSIITYALMNGASPEGPFNTLGQILFLGPMYFAPVSPSGAIPAGGNSIVEGENPGEIGCLPKLDSLGGGGGMGIGDLVGLAQKAYGLANTNWRNPASVLGAIGGVAGMMGMGGVAQAAGLAQTAQQLLTADWKHPGAAMGALMGAAGSVLSGSGLLGGGASGLGGPFKTTGGFAGGNPAQTGGSTSLPGLEGLPPGMVIVD